MPCRPVELLRVAAWGQTVGAVAAGRRGTTVFQYDPAWLRRGVELAPTTMPLAAGGRVHVFGARPAAFRGLPPMLADSLPDSFGTALVEAHLAQLGVSPAEISALDRLAYLGARGMGALEFEPRLEPGARPPTGLVLADLVTAARNALVGEVGPADQRPMAELLSVGTSAGGAQAKAVVAWDRQAGIIRPDGPDLPDSFEPWIVKLDVSVDGAFPAGAVEYAYGLMAQAAGIDLSDVELLRESGRAHFLTRRFDRRRGGKLHMQSLAALAGLDFTLLRTHSHAQLFQQADLLGLAPRDRQQILRRAAFNTLAANCDDHPKNWSFLMDESGRWELAPAYDLTYACDPRNPWLASHHLSVEGKHDHVTKADLLRFGDRFAVPGLAEAVAQVEDAVRDWPRWAAAARLPSAVGGAVGEALAGVWAEYAG